MSSPVTNSNRAGPSGRPATPMAFGSCSGASSSTPSMVFVGTLGNSTLPPGASKLPVNAYNWLIARTVCVALLCCSIPLHA